MDLTRPHDRLFAPVVTPFDAATEKVDEDGLGRFLQRLMTTPHLDAGVSLLMNSEAGEIYTLSLPERRRNVEIGVAVTEGRQPVLAGVTGNTTVEAIQTAVDALDAGATGLFILPPFGSLDITGSWNPERYPEILLDFVGAIVDEVGPDVPAILHPTAPKSPTYGIGLPLPTVLQVVKRFPQVVGWKMTYSYEGYRLVARALRELDRHVAILAASALRFHENLATGQFDGTVTGSMNYATEAIIEHVRAWQNDDVRAARKIWDAGLARLHEFVYSDYSRLHVRYKIAAWLRGYIESPLMRAPMPKPLPDEVRSLHGLLAAAGLDVRPVDELSAF